MLDAGGATVFPPQMGIAATGRDQDAYDVGKAIAEAFAAEGSKVAIAPEARKSCRERRVKSAKVSAPR